jgi:integrase
VQGFKADLLADGVGEAAVRKALSVLGAVLAKAVEWNRIPSNPATTVKKPSGKRKRRIAALAPEAVESIRDELSDKDALLVSILAYSGLRPGEALALEWSDIGKQSISVTKALSLGEVGATKTHVDRMVPLLKPLAADLKTLRGIGLVFPRSDGQPWSDTDYRNWRGRVWQPAAAKAGIATLERKTTKVKVDGKTIRRVKSSYVGPRPYDLRHSMASLLIGEGRNVAEIAETMGHSIAILLGTYAHVIAEHRGTKLVPAEARIKVARASTVPKAKAA